MRSSRISLDLIFFYYKLIDFVHLFIYYITGAKRCANHPTNLFQGERNSFHFFGVSLKLRVLSRSNIRDSSAVVAGSMITAFSS